MSSLPTLSFADFLAAAAPVGVVSDEIWASIEEGLPGEYTRESVAVYPGGYCLIHKDGAFWPIAWFYSPVAHSALRSAEISLYKWYLEFQPFVREEYCARIAAAEAHPV